MAHPPLGVLRAASLIVSIRVKARQNRCGVTAVKWLAHPPLGVLREARLIPSTHVKVWQKSVRRHGGDVFGSSATGRFERGQADT